MIKILSRSGDNYIILHRKTSVVRTAFMYEPSVIQTAIDVSERSTVVQTS